MLHDSIYDIPVTVHVRNIRCIDRIEGKTIEYKNQSTYRTRSPGVLSYGRKHCRKRCFVAKALTFYQTTKYWTGPNSKHVQTT